MTRPFSWGVTVLLVLYAVAILVPFDPDTGYGYWDYPLNGETETNQYRSYVRRDVMMLVKYAAAMTACQSEGWSFGNGGPLGLGDMSEADGAIPGTSVGSPGHPSPEPLRSWRWSRRSGRHGRRRASTPRPGSRRRRRTGDAPR